MKNKCIYCCAYTAEICPECAGKGLQAARVDELQKVGKVIDDWKFKLVGMLNMKEFHNKEIEVPLDIEDIEELKKELGI